MCARDAAVHHAHQNHRAAIRVEPGIENQRLQRRFRRARRRRNARDDRFQHRFHAEAAFGADQQRVGRGNRQDVFDLRLRFLGLRGGQIDLVDDRNDGEIVLRREERIGDGLRFDALAGVHDQQRAFAGGKRARNFVGKIDVAGRVDQVELVFVAVLGRVVQANALGLDGDAALALQVHRVEHLRAHLALAERAGKLEQAVGQRGLAVVNMRDDAKIADETWVHVSWLFRCGVAAVRGAPYGRAGVYMLQEFCQRVGIHAVDGDIQDLIEVLRLLPGGHPLQELLAQAPDFRNKGAVADALLHPRDRAFCVPQLFDLVANGELTFGRWVRQAPYSIHCGAAAKIPQANRIKRLSLPEQYAAIELFRGTMVRHSFTAYRSDSEASNHAVGFTGDAWLAYVPIRMAETVCIQDRLPPGAAAVLINTAHTYKDLLLPVNSKEKVWFDAIDGIRSIGEIVARPSPPAHEVDNLDSARVFFERLWWCDQVVFGA